MATPTNHEHLELQDIARSPFHAEHLGRVKEKSRGGFRTGWWPFILLDGKSMEWVAWCPGSWFYTAAWLNGFGHWHTTDSGMAGFFHSKTMRIPWLTHMSLLSDLKATTAPCGAECGTAGGSHGVLSPSPPVIQSTCRRWRPSQVHSTLSKCQCGGFSTGGRSKRERKSGPLEKKIFLKQWLGKSNLHWSSKIICNLNWF